MRFSRFVKMAAFSLLVVSAVLAAPAKQQDNHEHPLTAIKSPIAPYPDDAVTKGIEGAVSVRIVVDATGHVSDAKALSGPEELRPAAIASVKMWQFEPPHPAPRVTTVEIKYGFDKECPGPVSKFGEVTGNDRLVDKNGQLVALVDNDDYPLLPYPEKERKAGVAGTMILSVSLDQDGHVKEVHAVKSLSPALDKLAIDTVHPWKFKRAGSSPNASLEDLRLQFVFRGTCGLI